MQEIGSLRSSDARRKWGSNVVLSRLSEIVKKGMMFRLDSGLFVEYSVQCAMH